jgi:hypothetical protein
MAQEHTQDKGNTLKAINMYTWRLNRQEAEKREESVNRQIMRRQHAN